MRRTMLTYLLQHRLLAAVGVATLLSAVAPPAYANLIQNGGFETGDFTDWTFSGNIGIGGYPPTVSPVAPSRMATISPSSTPATNHRTPFCRRLSPRRSEQITASHLTTARLLMGASRALPSLRPTLEAQRSTLSSILPPTPTHLRLRPSNSGQIARQQRSPLWTLPTTLHSPMTVSWTTSRFPKSPSRSPSPCLQLASSEPFCYAAASLLDLTTCASSRRKRGGGRANQLLKHALL